MDIHHKDISSKIWLAFAFLLALIFFIQCFVGANRLSLTWDEPSFISAGYVYLTRSDFRLNPSHPPLMQELEALPLLSLHLKAPDYSAYLRPDMNPVVSFGRALIFESGNDPIKIASLARLPVMIIGAMLVFVIFLWGRCMFGPGPAIAAAALASFCPNLLAHSKLATEDLGCTAFFFFCSMELLVCLLPKAHYPQLGNLWHHHRVSTSFQVHCVDSGTCLPFAFCMADPKKRKRIKACHNS